MTTDRRNWKHADARPRIHVWDGDRPAYSFGPSQARFHPEAGTRAAAIEEALELVDHQPAVIIYEGRA